jgi:hypothetical protein
MAYTPWQLARPPVSADMARRIHAIRHEMTTLMLDVLGHTELSGCLRAAGAAWEECARIAMRDVDRARPALPKKRPKKKLPQRG